MNLIQLEGAERCFKWSAKADKVRQWDKPAKMMLISITVKHQFFSYKDLLSFKQHKGRDCINFPFLKDVCIYLRSNRQGRRGRDIFFLWSHSVNGCNTGDKLMSEARSFFQLSPRGSRVPSTPTLKQNWKQVPLARISVLQDITEMLQDHSVLYVFMFNA